MNQFKITANNVSKQFSHLPERDYPALSDVSFSIRPNEFVSLVGRSGCGKTTLLNLIAGFLKPSQGDILIDGKPIEGPGLDRGMVFQHSALFPWLTVKDNIEFGPKNRGMSKEARSRLSEELIDLIRLKGSEHKYPRELSGGMQQRVAIARALAGNPDVLLMDEPFGALDELTRAEMQNELLRVWEAHKKTVVFVTHGISEALLLSDRVLVFSTRPGRLRKEFVIDLPRPRTRTMPGFMAYYEEIHHAIN